MNPKALHKIGYGLYVVSAYRNDEVNGQIANTVFQTTSKPATLAVSINKDNYTHEFIELSRSFGVNMLDKDTPMTYAYYHLVKKGKSPKAAPTYIEDQG